MKFSKTSDSNDRSSTGHDYQKRVNWKRKGWMMTWNSLLLSVGRLVLVMLIPLSFDIRINALRIEYVHYHCILSRALTPQNFSFDSLYEPYLMLYPIILLSSIVLISAPLMYFEYRLRSASPDDSVMHLAIENLFVSTLLLFMADYSLSFTFSPFDLISSDLVVAFTWSIAVFVIFPILVREASLLGYQLVKGESKSKHGRISSRRYSILGYALGFLVVVFPYTIFNPGQDFSALEGIAFVLMNNVERISNLRIFGINIVLNTNSYLSSPLLLILLLNNIYFGVSLLRFSKGTAKRLNVLVTGLIGGLGPALNNLSIYPNTTIPIPALLIIGLLLMRKIPVAKTNESLWEGIPLRMWFEKPIEPDDVMKVPLRYVILSKLIYRSPRTNPSLPETQIEKVSDDD